MRPTCRPATDIRLVHDGTNDSDKFFRGLILCVACATLNLIAERYFSPGGHNNFWPGNPPSCQPADVSGANQRGGARYPWCPSLPFHILLGADFAVSSAAQRRRE